MLFKHAPRDYIGMAAINVQHKKMIAFLFIFCCVHEAYTYRTCTYIYIIKYRLLIHISTMYATLYTTIIMTIECKNTSDCVLLCIYKGNV